MKFTIDRFEGDFAIIELMNGTITQIPGIVLPIEAKEGDILSINIEIKETADRKISIGRNMAKLFKD